MSGALYSILITTYECHGKGVEFLRENLEAIAEQDYRPIQVVISDHSRDDLIEEYVGGFERRGLELVYVRYTEHYGNPSYNWSNALKYARGEYIHYFALDDKLYDSSVVEDIIEYMEISSAKWISTSYMEMPERKRNTPYWSKYLMLCNSLSGPSSVVIRKELAHIGFDPKFLFYLDVDWYYRLYREAGEPLCLKRVCWINRRGEHTLTNTVCGEDVQKRERKMMYEGHGDLFSILEGKYIMARDLPSDINEHIPILYEYAKECKHITECGVRYVVSSYAFGNALRGREGTKHILVDLDGGKNVNLYLEECENEGLDAIFYGESDLTCPIEDTDLLFIDTWHVYGHLKRELARWHSYAKKYIILHDTTVDGEVGESVRVGFDIEKQVKDSGIPREEIERGLWPAVEDFLSEHTEWVLKERFTNNNGLTVLVRKE